MAIRYFAYPVDADDIERARTDPYPRLGTDPHLDASGPEAERPDMLYLDTCWRLMQRLFLTRPGYPMRPAAYLVAGDVIMTEQGWIPHVEVLTPSQVAEVARIWTPSPTPTSAPCRRGRDTRTTRRTISGMSRRTSRPPGSSPCARRPPAAG
jgi:hypothetical protein